MHRRYDAYGIVQRKTIQLPLDRIPFLAAMDTTARVLVVDMQHVRMRLHAVAADHGE